MVMQRSTRHLLKDVGKGAALSLIAAYSFVVLLGLPYLLTSPSIPTLREVLATFPLIASFFSVWWVLPFGAFLGFALPKWAAHWNRRDALKKGAQLGFSIGFAGGFLIGIAFLHMEPGPLWVRFRKEPELFWGPLVLFGLSIGTYSAICVSIVARRYAGKS
jgi:hypothetical protein